MKTFKYLILLLLVFFIGPELLAQDGVICGRLYDQNEESIPFATVAVLKLPDSTIVTGTTTDLEGQFEVKPKFTGEVIFRFSAIGYSEVFSPSLKVNGPNYSKDLGIYVMQEEVTMLNEVMVNTWKPRIKVESDKLIMSVEGTALASGSSAYEMLSRAPGVTVGHSGGFMINGKQGVSVMIDGRLTYLSAAELKTMLESMPAENIKEIEVIHNPSAKYDAEGVAGILNITLKEDTTTGLTGSIYGGLRINEQKLLSGGLNLYSSSGKWNTFLNLDLSQRGYVRDQFQYRTFAGAGDNAYLDQIGEETNKRFIPSIYTGADYKLSSNQTLGGSANIFYQDRVNDWNTITTIGRLNSGEAVNIDARNHRDGITRNGRFNIYYEGQLDSVGTTLSADLDYVRLEREAHSRFLNSYTYLEYGSEEQQKLTNTSLSDYDIYAAKVDLDLPFSENSGLAMGVKGSKVISRSELQFFEEEEGAQVLNPDRSDRYRYEEEIYSAYASYSNRINDTWKVQLGLRAEQTYGEGISFNLDEKNPTEYLELFPNIVVDQQVNENYSLAYSYSRRIARPNYSTLNPFIFYLDPYSYIIGNPDLRPQFTNSLQFSQTLNKKYSLRLAYDFSKDHMGEVPSMDPDSRETVFTTANMDNYKTYGATLVLPVELASFWNVNNTIVYNRREYELQVNDKLLENKDDFLMIQSNHQVNMPFDLKLELNATYRSPYVLGLYDVNDRLWLDAGLKRSFLNDRLDMTLNATDVFRSQRSKIEADFLGNHYEMSQYFSQQAISINLRYNFSKGKPRQETRKKDLEELQRAGG
ncbi:outer membrane beta-barrel protein [Salinimicrobium catena]|uniref:outer membrane beta-barrel protein n=1 Tax=Salinimicrobium catena TaxID=390640 RepID=UPI002FE4E4AE